MSTTRRCRGFWRRLSANIDSNREVPMGMREKDYYDDWVKTLKPMRDQLRDLQKRVTKSKKGTPSLSPAASRQLQANKAKMRSDIKKLIDGLKSLKQKI